jgi:hypothetical protein
MLEELATKGDVALGTRSSGELRLVTLDGGRCEGLGTNNVILHSGGIDRTLIQDPGENSVDKDGTPSGGGCGDPDVINGGIFFSVAGIGCGACDLGDVGGILVEPSRSGGTELS